MATALLSPNAKQQFFDNAGNPAAGFKLYTYAAGTTNPQATYQDRAGTSANTNPIILDARGEAIIYLTPGVMYDYALTQADLTPVWTREDVSADAGDADAVSFLQSGAGAVPRSTQAKLRDTLNAKDFGVKADGVTDDTAALLAGIAEASARNAILQLPGGTIKVTPGMVVTSSNWEMVGQGQRATVITSAVATGDVLSIGDGIAATTSVVLRNISFTSSVARASDATLRVRNGFDIELEDLSFGANQAVCIQLDGGANQYLYKVKNLITFSGTIGLLVGRSGGLVQNLWWSDGTISNASDAGVLLENVSGMFARNTEVLTCNKGIVTFPAVGQGVKALFFSDLFIDTCVMDGLNILTNGGQVRDCNFSNIWAASNGASTGNAGILISPGAGLVKGITISTPRVVNNGGHGINIAGGTDIDLSNAQVFCNSTKTVNGFDGIRVSGGVTEFSIQGGRSGLGGEFVTNNQRYGISVEAGDSDNYTILGCDVRQNTTAGISDLGAGTNKHIANCLGARTVNNFFATVTTGTSSVAVNHGLAFTPAVHDILLTPLVDPNAAGIARWWVGSATSTQFTIMVNTNTSSDFFIGWSARVKGA